MKPFVYSRRKALLSYSPIGDPSSLFLSAAEATQIYEVRAVLEALAGEGFAVRASDTERAELRQVFEELKSISPKAGREALLGIKRNFYDVLLRGCRNEYATRMLDQMLNRNTQLRATSLSDPDRLPNTVVEIQRVMDAIERRDAEAAFHACRDHVINASKVALRLLRERESEQKNSG